MSEELTPFYFGVAEPPGGFKNVFPRNTQIMGYDAVRVEPPEEPPWVPLRDIVSRAPGCRVYWGSHGCHQASGHPADVPHECDCCDCANHPDAGSGCVARAPYYGPDTRFYGEDAERLGLPLVKDL